MRASVLLVGALAVLLGGCGEKADPNAMAAPPPKAGAVAPPVVPNGVRGGPQSMAPGSGVLKPGSPAVPSK